MFVKIGDPGRIEFSFRPSYENEHLKKNLNVQAYLRDSAGSVPALHNKASIIIRRGVIFLLVGV